MSKPKEMMRRIFEDVWNKQELSAIDELISSDYVHHDSQSPEVQKGVEGYRQFVKSYLAAFPDLQFTIEDEISDGDTAVIRWSAHGTHDGDLAAVPRTGRMFSISGMSIARFRHGKFVESWNNWDALGLMQQLGAVPIQIAGKAA